jgi:nicotinate-nucleotide adenylyltransferase
MIGLFGGSFDPIHHGHLLVAQAVCEALDLEELRFVPAFQQPFKLGRHSATPEMRGRMVGLAIAGYPRFRLETEELNRGGISYTVDTLRALAAREPRKRFALLVGADAAHDLAKWREGDQIPDLARVVAFTRPGVELPVLPGVHRVVTVPRMDISATEIRRRVARRQSIRYWVPDPVAECISREGLYLKDA